MTEIVLGKIVETGEEVSINLERLLETRLLVSANSGSGKSWLLRRILEQSHGKVQQIVLDLEGEFSTLREKYDYLLVGKGGDLPINMKAAELLAKKLLELNVSAIIDLYELKHHERIHFAKLFLDAMINAPKELWHPCLVIVDETHVYCPQKGESEAASSVIDLMTRGRKRGFTGILATQRLSKLNKDAAAEANNKLIGRAAQDVDMKRSGEELGFTTKADELSLRELDAGEFYCFGAAISKKIEKIKVGKIETSHPKIGARLGAVSTPTPAKIKGLLQKLADLPQEAEKEAMDKAALQKKIRELEAQLRSKAPVVDENALERAKAEGRYEAEKRFANFEVERFNQLKRHVAFVNKFKALAAEIPDITPDLEKERLRSKIERVNNKFEKTGRAVFHPDFPVQPPIPKTAKFKVGVSERIPRSGIQFENREDDGEKLGRCERAILKFLCMREGTSFKKTQIGALTGYSANSGGFNNALSKLRALELISGSSDSLRIIDVEKAREILGDEFLEASTESLQQWLEKLGLCSKKIYAKLLEDPERVYTREELGEETGYSPTSGGFNNSLSELSTLGLLERVDGGFRLSSEIQNL